MVRSSAWGAGVKAQDRAAIVAALREALPGWSVCEANVSIRGMPSRPPSDWRYPWRPLQLIRRTHRGVIHVTRRRTWICGPPVFAHTAEQRDYTGRGWRDRLVRDVVAACRAVEGPA